MLTYLTEENKHIFRDLPVIKADRFDENQESSSKKISLANHDCDSECK